MTTYHDYAYLARRPMDREVTGCDRCTAVLGAVAIVGLYVLAWCLEYIARAQAGVL